MMKFIINPLLESGEYQNIIKAIKDDNRPVRITGPSDSQKPHLCHAVCSHLEKKCLFITYNEMAARKLYDDFLFFEGENVVFFPAKEIMLHDIEAKSHDEAFQRIITLGRLILGDYKYIITSIEAISQKLVPEELFRSFILNISSGDVIDHSGLHLRLLTMGYERVEMVEGKGQYSARGGIIDIFPVNSEHAVRLEFFGDEVDSVRRFDILSQRSFEETASVTILPAREVLYSKEDLPRITSKVQNELQSKLKAVGNEEYRNHLSERINEDIERLGSDHYFPGVDRLIPYIIENPSCLPDYLTGSTIIFIDEYDRAKQRLDNLMLEHNEQCRALIEKGNILPGTFNMYFDFNEIENRLEQQGSSVIEGYIRSENSFGGINTVYLSTLPAPGDRLSRNFNIACRSIGSYLGHTNLLTEDLTRWKEKGARVLILSGTKGRGERLVEELSGHGIETYYTEDYENSLQPGQIVITRGSLNKGFEYSLSGLVVISDREAFGREKRRRKAKGSKDKIKSFTDLSIGDYVVHQSHGIGRYVGIQQLSVDGVKRDYLKISYLSGDFLYIPTNQLDLVQKYIGSEGKVPKLNKLGGSDWAKTKSKVKESLKELAEGLIKLYAQRQAKKGYLYSPDTVWQRQFEEAFPFEETDDQLKCISEIKSDMESEKVMDRLLCGDVGYGKTEVAIRAIFKAVMDSRQVAYLVPTTILAQQHFNNFKQRMSSFPVSVDVISRFRSQSEQKQILRDVKSGKIDVLIGTHRLLQKDLAFKNLGLLVVDEEQRFGVAHKERIKALKPDIDVLTLTATPIPRTLHMSLTGIRDISLLEDPPEERYPVQTYVMEYNPEVIRDAIEREMARKGQVFFLYNRVRTIHIKASEISELVPDARVGVAHGQMDEKELEETMMKFLNGEFDVLICTTIIESGLDMPNVNTIIVEDADKMGLSQLYQIRGRVGRSNRVAYAYITYKKDRVLSEVAEKRLSAIREFTEFGSGFRIAMRDLEIRGAGNLLGPEQHGQMETVGYEMYCKLLDEAVRELKGEPSIAEEAEITIDINVSAYINDEYIPSEPHKIEMYKRIASISDIKDVEDVRDELIDRFGDIPKNVENLIGIASIKSLSKECGFSSIQEKGDSIILQYRSNQMVKLESVGKLMEKYRRKLLFNASSTPYLTLRTAGIPRNDLIGSIYTLLNDICDLK